MADGLYELLRHFRFQNQPGGARVADPRRHLGGFVNGEKDNFGAWKNSEDARRGLQAIRIRHINVQDHYVWTGLLRLRNRFGAVARFGDNAAMQFCQQQPTDAAPDQFMVVGDKNPKPLSTSTHWRAPPPIRLFPRGTIESLTGRRLD